ncbi:MAG: hypothetical protein IPK04_22755 [Bdellovibrionales bacterium]|nr:hypothetical protein [Bdellovibrionales bacterium]
MKLIILILVLVRILVITPQARALSCRDLVAGTIFELPITQRSQTITKLVGKFWKASEYRTLAPQEAERLAALARSGNLTDQAITDIFLKEYRQFGQLKIYVPLIEFIEGIKLRVEGVIAIKPPSEVINARRPETLALILEDPFIGYVTVRYFDKNWSAQYSVPLSELKWPVATYRGYQSGQTVVLNRSNRYGENTARIIHVYEDGTAVVSPLGFFDVGTYRDYIIIHTQDFRGLKP